MNMEKQPNSQNAKGKRRSSVSGFLDKPGNASLVVGAMFSVSAASCPCPLCIGTASLLMINGIREKLKKRHQSCTIPMGKEEKRGRLAPKTFPMSSDAPSP